MALELTEVCRSTLVRFKDDLRASERKRARDVMKEDLRVFRPLRLAAPACSLATAVARAIAAAVVVAHNWCSVERRQFARNGVDVVEKNITFIL